MHHTVCSCCNYALEYCSGVLVLSFSISVHIPIFVLINYSKTGLVVAKCKGWLLVDNSVSILCSVVDVMRVCVWRPVIGWLTADHPNVGLWLADWPPGTQLTNSVWVWLVWPVHHWSVLVTIGQCVADCPVVRAGAETTHCVQWPLVTRSKYNSYQPIIMGGEIWLSCNVHISHVLTSVVLIVKVNLLDFRCRTF